MPTLHSGDWDEQVGACIKHAIPELPCQQCLAEVEAGQNNQVFALLNEADRTQLDWDSEFTLRDTFPKGALGDRLMATLDGTI